MLERSFECFRTRLSLSDPELEFGHYRDRQIRRMGVQSLALDRVNRRTQARPDDDCRGREQGKRQDHLQQDGGALANGSRGMTVGLHLSPVGPVDSVDAAVVSLASDASTAMVRR